MSSSEEEHSETESGSEEYSNTDSEEGSDRTESEEDSDGDNSDSDDSGDDSEDSEDSEDSGDDCNDSDDSDEGSNEDSDDEEEDSETEEIAKPKPLHNTAEPAKRIITLAVRVEGKAPSVQKGPLSSRFKGLRSHSYSSDEDAGEEGASFPFGNDQPQTSNHSPSPAFPFTQNAPSYQENDPYRDYLNFPQQPVRHARQESLLPQGQPAFNSDEHFPQQKYHLMQTRWAQMNALTKQAKQMSLGPQVAAPVVSPYRRDIAPNKSQQALVPESWDVIPPPRHTQPHSHYPDRSPNTRTAAAGHDVSREAWLPLKQERSPHTQTHAQSQTKPSAFGSLVVTFNPGAKAGGGRHPSGSFRRVSTSSEVEHDALSGI